ncbi:MAG: hypothetical protein SVZ03_08885 [Spirochaetota bacterium]|nr:hypothetical protein [Spirochaetota bacterium]
MKNITLIVLFFLILGCTSKKITEREFGTIFGEYIQREFVESFDEKQSVSQREKILMDVLSKHKIDFEMFKEYMRKKHEDKYKKIFLE